MGNTSHNVLVEYLVVNGLMTGEPLIMDTLKSGQSPYNGQTVHPLPTIHFHLQRRDNI